MRENILFIYLIRRQGKEKGASSLYKISRDSQVFVLLHPLFKTSCFGTLLHFTLIWRVKQRGMPIPHVNLINHEF